ncbi:hypothetical protein Hypma_014502 [Hypsizygus marmoreus]|uniref:Uncharacterized protein n=1 Tax=Hypsizygus marmoreus TaxID=39966 RepID=A0A369J9L0_HYPMA|nr:hypothetical protein Hypma_014502 [Hypsizygus marmoreus]
MRTTTVQPAAKSSSESEKLPNLPADAPDASRAAHRCAAPPHKPQDAPFNQPLSCNMGRPLQATSWQELSEGKRKVGGQRSKVVRGRGLLGNRHAGTAWRQDGWLPSERFTLHSS